MGYLALYMALGILLVIGAWQLAVWLGEIQAKNKQYEKALAHAREHGKPLLVAGGSWGTKWTRQLIKKPAHGSGDVCLDIDRRAIDRHPSGVIASVTHIPFSDKSFGAVFASHVLEHLPGTEEAKQATAELHRTAEGVFLAYPSRQSIAAWIIPGHHLWVWQKDGTIYFEQRGKQAGKQREEYLH